MEQEIKKIISDLINKSNNEIITEKNVSILLNENNLDLKRSFAEDEIGFKIINLIDNLKVIKNKSF